MVATSSARRPSVSELPVYHAAPQGMVTVADASDELQVAKATIYQWIRHQAINRVGLLLRAGNLQSIALLDRDEVWDRALWDRQQLPIYPHIPVGMQTLPHMANETGVSCERLRDMIRRKEVRPRGRLRFPVRGGGKILVDIEEVVAATDNRQAMRLTT